MRRKKRTIWLFDFCIFLGLEAMSETIGARLSATALGAFGAMVLAGVLILIIVRAQRRRLPTACLRCGYDLRGAVSRYCSECGLPNNFYVNGRPERPRAIPRSRGLVNVVSALDRSTHSVKPLPGIA